MRILLLSIGSRGDVEPFCALAQELLHNDLAAAVQVDFFIERNHTSLVTPLVANKYAGDDDDDDNDDYRDHNDDKTGDRRCHVRRRRRRRRRLTIHHFPFENAGFIRQMRNESPSRQNSDASLGRETVSSTTTSTTSKMSTTSASIPSNIDQTVDVMKRTILPCLDQVLTVARHCDVIVSCNLTNILCILLINKLRDAGSKVCHEQLPSSSISSSISDSTTHDISDADVVQLRIPKVVFLHLQPLVPNTIFPYYRTVSKRTVCNAILDRFFPRDPKDVQPSSTDPVNQCSDYKEVAATTIGAREDGIWDSYWTLDKQLHGRLFGRDLVVEENSFQMQVDHPGREGRITNSWEDWMDIYSGRKDGFYIVNGYSKYLIPLIAGTSNKVGRNVIDVGPLADNYIPFVPSRSLDKPVIVNSTDDGHHQHQLHDEEEDRLREKILAFCQERRDDVDEGGGTIHRPLCIGFGSTPVPHNTVCAVYKAIEDLGHPKTILVGDALRIDDGRLLPSVQCTIRNVLHIPSVSYPWLLPHCSVMVCHGGMGVLHACLRAGIPTVVCPAMGDQFMNAALVHGLGLGRQAGVTSLNRLTSDDLVDALRAVVKDLVVDDGHQRCDRICQRCHRVADLIRAEPTTGVQRMVHWLTKISQESTIVTTS